MTEYTPTTTEVRDRFARDLFDNADRPVGESFRLFDRWLAEHTRQVVERAWERGWLDEPYRRIDENHYRKDNTND